MTPMATVTPPRPARKTTRPVGRPDPGRRRTVYFIAIFIACVLVANALVGDRGLIETMRARKQYAELAASIARLKQENAQLLEEARRLREDPQAIEEIARRELGLIKPGEVVFIVKDVPSPGPRPEKTPNPTPGQRP